MCCKADPLTALGRGTREQQNMCDTSNIVLVVAGSGGFVSVGTIGTKFIVMNDIIDTSALTQERHSICRSNSSTEEEVVFCDMDISKQFHQLSNQKVEIVNSKVNAKKGAVCFYTP